MRDLKSNIAVETAIAPAVINATVEGAVIDTFGCNRLAFTIATGAIVSSGDFAMSVEDSADGVTFAAVAGPVDNDTPATLAANTAYTVGYRGWERYVRLVLTKTGGTSIALSAVAIKSDLATAPAV